MRGLTIGIATAVVIAWGLAGGGIASAQPPVPSVFDLPDLIRSAGGTQGISASLLAKAYSAIEAYEHGWPDDLGVVDHLSGMLREVRQHAGRLIPAAGAAQLVDVLQRLIVDLRTPIITCAVEDLDPFRATISECREVGGAVQECIPLLGKGEGEGAAKGNTALALGNFTETDPLGPLGGWITNVSVAVAASNVTSHPVVPGSYTCGEFSRDLQTYLNGQNYSTSFVVIYRRDSKGNIVSAHAVVAVHAPDGTVVIVEPQNGDYLDFDLDDDGIIEFATDHPKGDTSTWPNTDDNVRIEVYKDFDAAKKAGGKLR